MSEDETERNSGPMEHGERTSSKKQEIRFRPSDAKVDAMMEEMERDREAALARERERLRQDQLCRARGLRFMGSVLLWAGLALIAFGSIGVLMSKGIVEFLKLLSPFNIINYIVMFVVLAPGLALRTWAERLEKPQNG